MTVSQISSLSLELLVKVLHYAVEDVHDARRLSNVCKAFTEACRLVIRDHGISNYCHDSNYPYVTELLEKGQQVPWEEGLDYEVGDVLQFKVDTEACRWVMWVTRTRVIHGISNKGNPFIAGGMDYHVGDVFLVNVEGHNKKKYIVSDFYVRVPPDGENAMCRFQIDEKKVVLDDFSKGLDDQGFKCVPRSIGLNLHSPEDEGEHFLATRAPDGLLTFSGTPTDSVYELKLDWRNFDTYGRVSFFSLGVFDELQKEYTESICTQGTAFFDTWVEESLRMKLVESIDEMGAKTVVDYHPHSNNVVRDLVHPALYPYIHQVSKIRENVLLPKRPQEDFWGRKFEDSVYQWLPTYFCVDSSGKATIEDYVNNLPTDFHDVYAALEELFSVAVPALDVVLNNCYHALPLLMTDEKYRYCCEEPCSRSNATIKGTKIQVITKIVDYELGPGQSYEGVWHVEGMSHERIVATVLYIADRSDSLDGGAISFKRAFFGTEHDVLHENVGQESWWADQFVAEGTVPLGKIETPQGRLVVFPNCNIHRVEKLVNISGAARARRRIVVFFIVDPDTRIISTREVPPQQDHVSSGITRQAALDHRLKLMHERKYHKQDFNIREVNLCEH